MAWARLGSLMNREYNSNRIATLLGAYSLARDFASCFLTPLETDTKRNTSRDRYETKRLVDFTTEARLLNYVWRYLRPHVYTTRIAATPIAEYKWTGGPKTAEPS